MLLFCPLAAWGQLLTVTATLTDSDSIVWANATCTVQIYSPNGPAFFGSTAVPIGPQPCTVNGSGVLSTSIYNTSTISPTGAQYQFTIASATSAPGSSFNTPVTAANMTSTLSALLVAPRFSAYTPFAYGYADVEVVASKPNGQYYNTVTPAFRQWGGSSWATVGSSSGGGGCTSEGSVGTLQVAGTVAGTCANGFGVINLSTGDFTYPGKFIPVEVFVTNTASNGNNAEMNSTATSSGVTLSEVNTVGASQLVYNVLGGNSFSINMWSTGNGAGLPGVLGLLDGTSSIFIWNTNSTDDLFFGVPVSGGNVSAGTGAQASISHLGVGTFTSVIAQNGVTKTCVALPTVVAGIITAC